MVDDRVAIVSDIGPFGTDDKVMFEDGHEETTTAWQIAEMLTDEDDDPPDSLLTKLRTYLRDES